MSPKTDPFMFPRTRLDPLLSPLFNIELSGVVHTGAKNIDIDVDMRWSNEWLSMEIQA